MESESECPKIMISTPGVASLLTAGKDYSEYNKEFRLRTDAVWEKYQLKDWFRLASKVIVFNYFRCSFSTSDQWGINSSSRTMFTHCFSSHGVLKKSKLWTGEVSPTQVSQQLSNAVSVQSKKWKVHSTVFTQCPITTLCALWDSRNGSDATAPTDMTELPNTIEAQTVDWPTWRTKTIIHVSENGIKLHMHVLITSWSSWWNYHSPRKPKTSGSEMSATVKWECSPPFMTHQTLPKESLIPIDFFT